MLQTFYDESFDAFFSVEVREPGADYPDRTIDHHTMVWVQEGRWVGDLDFSPLDIAAPRMFFISPGQPIRIQTSYPQRSVIVSFNKNFYCVERHDAEVSCNGLLFNGALPVPVIELDAAETVSFQNLLTVMLEEVGVGDRIQREMLLLLLKRWIIKCTRLAREQMDAVEEEKTPEVDLIRSYSALVDKHFKQWHKVADYADQLFRSPKTLSNLFRKYGLQSPSEVIQERILLEAKRMLIYTDQSVKEIAFELGFDEPSAFSRYFTKRAGKSPRQFRENW